MLSREVDWLGQIRLVPDEQQAHGERSDKYECRPRIEPPVEIGPDRTPSDPPAAPRPRLDHSLPSTSACDVLGEHREQQSERGVSQNHLAGDDKLAGKTVRFDIAKAECCVGNN
jgi:hypothetical protein